jgi:hypothetical protein
MSRLNLSCRHTKGLSRHWPLIHKLPHSWPKEAWLYIDQIDQFALLSWPITLHFYNLGSEHSWTIFFSEMGASTLSALFSFSSLSSPWALVCSVVALLSYTIFLGLPIIVSLGLFVRITNIILCIQLASYKITNLARKKTIVHIITKKTCKEDIHGWAREHHKIPQDNILPMNLIP